MDQYITPEEAVKLSQQNTVAEVCIAKDIYSLFQQSKQGTDLSWKFYNAIATIYNAGRVAGIRQERAKRNRNTKALCRTER